MLPCGSIPLCPPLVQHRRDGRHLAARGGASLDPELDQGLAVTELSDNPVGADPEPDGRGARDGCSKSRTCDLGDLGSQFLEERLEPVYRVHMAGVLEVRRLLLA